MYSFLFSEAELKVAAALSHEAFMSSLPEPEDCNEHRFSERFDRKMEPLFALEKKKLRSRGIIKNVAAVFLAILISLSVWLAIDTDARAAAVKWIREVFDNIVVYRLVDEHDTMGKPSYVLTWIPEGLELIESYDEEYGCGAFYLDETGMTGFAFDYSYTSDSQMQIITKPGQVIEKVQINGIEADFYPENVDDDTRVLIWVDEEYNIMLSIAGNLDNDTILRIAENITVEKK